MAGLILVRNVAGELRPKRTLAASCGFLAAARLSCYGVDAPVVGYLPFFQNSWIECNRWI